MYSGNFHMGIKNPKTSLYKSYPTKHDTFIKRFLKVSKRLVNEKHFKNVYQTFFFNVFFLNTLNKRFFLVCFERFFLNIFLTF